MPTFGNTSMTNLASCHTELQRLFNIVIKFYDCSATCGHRNQADQDKAFAEGKSKEKWPNSKHNSLPSMAVDVVPYFNGLSWKETQDYHFAGFVLGIAKSLGINIRCGADFNQNGDVTDDSFKDPCHFELIV